MEMHEYMRVGINHFSTQKEMDSFFRKYCKICEEKDCEVSFDGSCAYTRVNNIEIPFFEIVF